MRRKVLIEWPSGALEIDATQLYGWETAAEITEHPVESGAAVSDHIRPLNGTLTLEGIITDAPIEQPATQMDGVALSTGTVVAGRERATGQTWSGPVTRVRQCDTVLDELVRAGTLVTATTGLRTVESLAIARYKAERSADLGGAVKVTLELRAVRIASTRRTAVPAVRRAQIPQQRGAQPTDTRSALARIVDGGSPATVARERIAARRGS